MRETIKEYTTTLNLISGIPWCCNNFKRYIRCAHCDKMYWTWQSIFRLSWNNTPNNLTQLSCSISSRAGGIWKCSALGLLKTISLVLRALSRSLVTDAQTFTCSNSSWILTSVCSWTTKVVSSAYLKTVFILEIAWRSLFITAYNIGPIPDPWTTLGPMLLGFDRWPLTLHCWLRSVKNEQIQFTTYTGKSKALAISYLFNLRALPVICVSCVWVYTIDGGLL